MNKAKNDFQKSLFLTFKAEAQDHLNTVSNGLLELEKIPSPEVEKEIIETIYRDTHSLKGAARAVNITDIETICRSLENIFGAWKKKKLEKPPELFDILYRTIDRIRKIISSHDEGQTPYDKSSVSKLIQDLSGLKVKEIDDRVLPEEGKLSQESRLVKEYPTLSETVRVSTAKLNSLLLQAEEMLPMKLMANEHTAAIKDISEMLEILKNACKEVYRETLQAQRTMEKRNGGNEMDSDTSHSIRLKEFIHEIQTQIKSIEKELAMLQISSKQYSKRFDGMIDNLLNDMKKAMMIPFSTLLGILPMLVRNLSNEQGKEASLIMTGEGIEMDRRILEEMKDPLIHLIRNCIDHGIEKPEERGINKKPRRGTITIAISRINGDKAEVIISDDGAGIDIAKVKEMAVKNKILSQREADTLSEGESLSLIFYSGLSTSPIITDVSGRGLGLAIVQEKVERLKGSISVETRINSGTKFRILLPITISTFRGILVRVVDHVFIIPTISVECVLRIRNDEIKTVENRETILLYNSPISFVRLESVLNLTPQRKRGDGSQFTTVVLVIAHEKKCIAFGVDRILNEQEVLVKGLGKQLSRVQNVAGAAVIGSGEVVPILNVSDLLKSALKIQMVSEIPSVAGEEEAGVKSIMVVEDSVTSRVLLKNILESAGYTVQTAVDGIDAITRLKTEDFDLVVSDIEMPRMDGFDLTLKIRDDKKLSELPVILVTALEKREDRERGIEAGANAYIVKSSFNQENLLEVIRRLI
ncbi:MAG: response regulator [Nitrospinota bacterium]